MSPAGPVAIIAVAVIVLTVLWKTATPLMAVIMAAAALLAGVILLVLMYGTKPRRRREGAGSPGLWRRRRF
ncbi:hypothetical protein SAMN05443665_104358 [Actinomadura meyerae]|jgi:hypothetical protein|uniref:Uncharacterized protein n=1 Tax=Actinomadura meyerae TaxID=240840 RepID=A0A239NLR9_9ACTN|nr:Uncharacterised protein [Mycobacterium tuberculosis]SNT55298.1 hypothetical protein SAMN05443665_104358 [Actinomadura meyerae]